MKKIELVFRTIGERTSAIALELAKKYIAPDRVHIIENVKPFSQAVKQMLAIQYEGDEVVFMDADCLIMENMRPFLEKNEMPYVDCYVRDKFRGNIHLGVHITRIDLVRAMQEIGLMDHEKEFVLWPESALRHVALEKISVEDKALKHFRIFHDFCQFYHHIFVKYAQRELRSRETPYRQALWNLNMQNWVESDPDFVVAKHAVDYTKRMIHPGESAAEIARFIAALPDIAQQELRQLGIEEKTPLTWEELRLFDDIPDLHQRFGHAKPKVFGIGLSRTGTKSITLALNILGFNVLHYPTEPSIFEKLSNGEYDFSLLECFDGITDITVAPFYAQLDRLYPNSKFILTVREKDAWLNSLEKHWRNKPPFDDTRRDVHMHIRRLLRAAVYGTYQFNRERMAYVYDLHYRNVTEYFKDRPESLLVLDVTRGDGWKKLCPFLDRPILDEPFPDVKKTSDM